MLLFDDEANTAIESKPPQGRESRRLHVVAHSKRPDLDFEIGVVPGFAQWHRASRCPLPLVVGRHCLQSPALSVKASHSPQITLHAGAYRSASQRPRNQ